MNRYLHDVGAGGRTVFPACGFHRGFREGTPLKASLDFYEDPDWSKDCREIAVPPRRGAAVVHFPAALPAAGGRTDGNALHRAEPVLRGEKYVLQQFVTSCGKWCVDSSSTAAGRLSAATL